jgi:hypothetical protein
MGSPAVGCAGAAGTACPSPDRADALAYTFAYPYASAYVGTPAIDIELHQGEHITGDPMQKAW